MPSLEARIEAKMRQRMLAVLGPERLSQLHARLVEFIGKCESADGAQLPWADEFSRLDRDLAEIMRTRFLLECPSARAPRLDGCIVVSNHIGIAKSVKIYGRDTRQGGDSLFLNDEPFMLLWAGIRLGLRQALPNLNFSPVQVQYQGLGKELQDAYGAVVLPKGSGRVTLLARRFKASLERGDDPCWGFMPEGGTTGKRTMLCHIDTIDQFHLGAFILAARCGVPIVPVVQAVTVRTGHCVGVLEPVEFDPRYPSVHAFSGELRRRMIAWIASRQ